MIQGRANLLARGFSPSAVKVTQVNMIDFLGDVAWHFDAELVDDGSLPQGLLLNGEAPTAASFDADKTVLVCTYSDVSGAGDTWSVDASAGSFPKFANGAPLADGQHGFLQGF